MIYEEDTLNLHAVRTHEIDTLRVPSVRMVQYKPPRPQFLLRLIAASLLVLSICLALFMAIQVPSISDKIWQATPTQVPCVHVVMVQTGQNISFVNDYSCRKR